MFPNKSMLKVSDESKMASILYFTKREGLKRHYSHFLFSVSVDLSSKLPECVTIRAQIIFFRCFKDPSETHGDFTTCFLPVPLVSPRSAFGEVTFRIQ